MARRKKIIIPKQYQEMNELLVELLNVHPLAIKLLINRGLVLPKDINFFLKASWQDLYSPNLFQGMPRIASRVLKAIREKENILIYGDYDVDGITSTALLKSYFSAHGAQEVTHYIPNRFKEGYGLHKEALEEIIFRDKINLLITVDCGINAKLAINRAEELGVDCIITDHHIAEDVLPSAFGIINPKLNDSTYPFSDLAGVGVAFKLCQAIQHQIDGQYWSRELENLLVFVALGTVADLVPLRGENRIFVKEGLKKINEKPSLGLKALLDICNIRERVDSGHIGFLLAPRLNAAGRLDDADLALELLMTTDPMKASELANTLNQLNEERKSLEAEVVMEAREIFQTNKEQLVYVGGSPDWHPGVLGIAASRLVGEFNRPTLLIGYEGDIGRGSGRSIEGFNLYRALEYSAPHLIKYGGHKMAAGLTVSKGSMEDLGRVLNEYANRVIDDDLLVPRTRVDEELPLSLIGKDFLTEFQKLAPFGVGNPNPVFFSTNLQIDGLKKIGKDSDHLFMRISESGKQQSLKAIAFNQGDQYESLLADKESSAVFTPKVSHWRRQENIELHLYDVFSKGTLAHQVDKEPYSSLDLKGKIISSQSLRNFREFSHKKINAHLQDSSKIVYLLANNQRLKQLKDDFPNFHTECFYQDGFTSKEELEASWKAWQEPRGTLIITTVSFFFLNLDRFPELDLLFWESPFPDYPTAILFELLSKIEEKYPNKPYCFGHKFPGEPSLGLQLSEGGQSLGEDKIKFKLFKNSYLTDDSFSRGENDYYFVKSLLKSQELKIRYPQKRFIYSDYDFKGIDLIKTLFFVEVPETSGEFLKILDFCSPASTVFIGPESMKNRVTIPNKEIMTRVYKTIRETCGFDKRISDEEIKNKLPYDLEYFNKIVDVFAELGLVKRLFNGEGWEICMTRLPGFVDLFDSMVYNEFISEVTCKAHWYKLIAKQNIAEILQAYLNKEMGIC